MKDLSSMLISTFSYLVRICNNIVAETFACVRPSEYKMKRYAAYYHLERLFPLLSKLNNCCQIEYLSVLRLPTVIVDDVSTTTEHQSKTIGGKLDCFPAHSRFIHSRYPTKTLPNLSKKVVRHGGNGGAIDIAQIETVSHDHILLKI